MDKKIQILKGFEKRFLSGFPWLYANEIADFDKTKAIAAGELVSLFFRDKPYGIGYFNRQSLISFRLLSSQPDEQIDKEFFIKRFAAALRLRETFYTHPHYRLIHAEADGLPGLIVDRFAFVFVVQLNTAGMEKLSGILTDALLELFPGCTIILERDSTIRALEGLPSCNNEIIGKKIEILDLEEGGIRFSVLKSNSQKTGWFFDHRENRELIKQIAEGKRVIDYFCYSGGFSLYAAKGGAKSVIGVDRSESAISNAKVAAELNGLTALCSFVCDDAFKDLEKRAIAHEKFDLVILDPPAFVKTKKDLAAGLKGYEKLLIKAMAILADNAWLLIASCSYHVKEEDLRNCVNRALYKTRKNCRIVRNLGAGYDHPWHPQLAESAYLKGFLLAFF